jgi:glycogen(starch) synthase
MSGSSPAHVLITADAVGGVWTYALTLARELTRRYGVQVSIATFGPDPSEEQRSAAAAVGAAVYPLGFRLEWMDQAHLDHAAAVESLRGLVRRLRPDILHANQHAFGVLSDELPTLVVSHSDVLSWWSWVLFDGAGFEPPEYLNWYRQTVQQGLHRATAVACPSRFTQQCLARFYHLPEARLIYNGVALDPAWTPGATQHTARRGAIVAGRLWDRAKNITVVIEAARLLRGRVPVTVAGPCSDAEGRCIALPEAPGLTYTGMLPQPRLLECFRRHALYVAASCYEPFGLSAVEAALCGCAVVASDIPSHRELWEGAAVFFQHRSPENLAARLEALEADPAWRNKVAAACLARARRFSASEMAVRYLALYRELMAAPRHVPPPEDVPVLMPPEAAASPHAP